MKVHDERGKEIAESLGRIATQLKYLGNGNAADGGMGAIENLAMQLKDGLEAVSDSLSGLADAVKSSDE